ncbi:putative F-box protein PP2-B12 [Prosopis cineraria]|uniref:putative F-box protein PP2-B12 n=1 Tax=Prosopis cineraria TaxID=364024 RepID=UPI0024106996|nr:putative F-box protein PP2-B12 [Prosopis cineraria]XP_054794135.1 putative F-box protein PP2-B12 [Prosopis cineraria]
MTKVLPVDCISNIISLTSPKDACRTCSVASVFRTAEDSDTVWERFLPGHYEDMIARSSSQSFFTSSLTKKQIFFHLCDHPVLLNDGKMCLGLEKDSGKKCCMLSAKGLTIVWADRKSYWQWISLPESRFTEVAKLNHVWWLDIKARVKVNDLLSPGTIYSAFFVYKLEEEHSMADRYVELSVNNEESVSGSHRRVILDPSSKHSIMKKKQRASARKREDGWMEVEMGEFFISGHYGCEGFTEFRLWETNGYIKDGLIVEGIEFRPKCCV